MLNIFLNPDDFIAHSVQIFNLIRKVHVLIQIYLVIYNLRHDIAEYSYYTISLRITTCFLIG